jgi:hypothetical protein
MEAKSNYILYGMEKLDGVYMKKHPHITIIVILMMLLLTSNNFLYAKQVDPTEEIQNKLNVVNMLLEKHQYLKAKRELEKIIKKYIDDDPDSGLGYPESIRCQIKSFESQIDDKTGQFKDLPKFTGRVTESECGAHAGYFDVIGDKSNRRKSFIWDCGLITEGEGSFLKIGSKVTVYHLPGRNDSKDSFKACKILCDGNERKKAVKKR